ncbi:hypothetical protein OAI63_01980 [Candidatus Pelagibacter sp.]|nr:hypothetical protein [Candidatus Pelagibacter sp.]
MRKVKIKDNQGKLIEIDIVKFKKHLDEHHSNGSSVHEEDGHYFTINQNFRNKILNLYEQK